MAHYKHKRCRYGRESHVSETYWRKKRGLTPVKLPKNWTELLPQDNMDERRRAFWPREFRAMANYPRAWDIRFHTRPRRTKEKRIAKGIVTGRILAEEALWPLSRRPHIYYY